MLVLINTVAVHWAWLPVPLVWVTVF